VCHANGDGVRVFELRIDGDPLRLQPRLCAACGDSYLIRIGHVLGTMCREHDQEHGITPARGPSPGRV
jgi:hypothetical protein